MSEDTRDCGCKVTQHWLHTEVEFCPLHKAAPNLLEALVAAMNALRSYQYGNGSPDLAESIADACDAAIAKAKGGQG